MSVIFAIYVGVPLLTVAINALLAYWIYTNHMDVRGAEWFVATILLGIAWMWLEVVHLVVADHSIKVLAMIFATKFAALSFVTGVVFFSLYSRSDFHRHPLTKLALGTVLAATLLPTFVSPVQEFVYASVAVAEAPVAYVMVEPGIGYRVIGILLAITVGYALVATVRYLLSTPRRSGLQLVLLILGALSVMIAIVLGDLGVFPLENKAHAAFGALPQAVLVTLALFRFRLFEMQPVARNTVVEALTDPVIIVDRDGRIVDYNGASGEIWPQVADGVGEDLAAACPAVAAVVDLDADGETVSDRLQVHVDGQERHYSVRVSTAGEGPDLYAILLRDVTELEQSRWQLARQNERLEQVSATISHDLRNPINVASGRAELLADLLDGDGFDESALADAREHVGAIQRSHERMGEIIEDVLTLAREGQSVESTRRQSLATVAREAWEGVDTMDATLTVDDDRLVEADRSKLIRLLENLFRNAIEHAGSDVAVRIGPISDGFCVADDGPGIPPADAEQVFEYGFSEDSDGTGLGLSIVRTIAESHGWTVELDEEFEAGARFCIHGVAVAPAPDSDRDQSVQALD